MVGYGLSLLCSALFTLWCLWLFKSALSKYGVAKASQNWPHTQGLIMAVELWGLRNIGGTMQDVERLTIKYSYEVNGQKYESTRIAFFTIIYPETLHFAQAHPVGSDLPVWFNPKNPAESVVIPGLNPAKPYSDIIIAGFGLVVGFGVTVGVYSGLIS